MSFLIEEPWQNIYLLMVSQCTVLVLCKEEKPRCERCLCGACSVLAQCFCDQDYPEEKQQNHTSIQSIAMLESWHLPFYLNIFIILLFIFLNIFDSKTKGPHYGGYYYESSSKNLNWWSGLPSIKHTTFLLIAEVEQNGTPFSSNFSKKFKLLSPVQNHRVMWGPFQYQ